MSELRLNPVTREWVIMAPRNGFHPADFRRPEARPNAPARLDTCPFCPGNEHRTDGELYRIARAGAWSVRVIVNKYAVLSRAGEKKISVRGIMRSVAGTGLHEVIIETPIHNTGTALLEIKEVEDMIRTYRLRFIEAYKDERVEHVIIFKNHGEKAGTSITHPHSQLIATPVVPVRYRDRVLSAMNYHDYTGTCVICDIVGMEKAEGARILAESEHFLSFIPYAALSPFHTWIFPKRHGASFSDITDAEVIDFAAELKAALQRIFIGLEDPDYNYVIRSSRPVDATNRYCHWYLSLVPRVTETAGFELGTGMFINTVLPEESAAFLRSVRI